MITRIVKLHFQAEKINEFKQLFEKVKQLILAQEGCKSLSLLQDQSDPCLFFTYSQWQSQAALDAYKNTPLFETTWAATKILFDQAPQAWSTHAHFVAPNNSPHYCVQFGKASHLLEQFLAQNNYSQIFVLIDENTQKHCLPLLQQTKQLQAASLICIASGEENKTLQTCEKIWQELINHQANRSALLINLGGGVIGDMGGFCASCYKRGIDFVQIPTTLLAQVDASVGGKLGIDFQGLKNIVGHFQQAQTVIIDPQFLSTLPFEQVRSGFAEMLKHALIEGENDWKQLVITDLKSTSYDSLLNLISQSVNIKKAIVIADPLEKGIRKALNLGHTIGHAVETYFLNTQQLILHGEAVAYGLLAEAYIALQRAVMPQTVFDQMYQEITALFPPIKVPQQAIPQIIAYTYNDKKNEANEINATLLATFGKVLINQQITTTEIETAIVYLNQKWSE